MVRNNSDERLQRALGYVAACADESKILAKNVETALDELQYRIACGKPILDSIYHLSRICENISISHQMILQNLTLAATCADEAFTAKLDSMF